MVTQRWQEWILQLINWLINSLRWIDTFYILVCKLHNFPFLIWGLRKLEKILFTTLRILFFDRTDIFIWWLFIMKLAFNPYSCWRNNCSFGWFVYFLGLNCIYVFNVVWCETYVLGLIHFVHEHVLIWLLYFNVLTYFIRWVVYSTATLFWLGLDLRFLKLLIFN